MKLKEIAERISVHLKRIEADPKLNPWRNGSTRPFYHACAWPAGRYVRVKYISYQGFSTLPKVDAELYLEWLDAGNNGRYRKTLAARPAPASGEVKP